MTPDLSLNYDSGRTSIFRRRDLGCWADMKLTGRSADTADARSRARTGISLRIVDDLVMFSM